MLANIMGVYYVANMAIQCFEPFCTKIWANIMRVYKLIWLFSVMSSFSQKYGQNSLGYDYKIVNGLFSAMFHSIGAF